MTQIVTPSTTQSDDNSFRLVPIQQRDGELLVDARALHSFLEINTRFNDWVVRRLADALAVEGEDFYSILSNTNGVGRPATEYLLTIDLAKELAMLERSEKGRAIRRYFIQAEKELRARLGLPAPSYPEALRQLADTLEAKAQAEAALQLATPKVEAFDALMSADGTYAVGDAAKILGTGEIRLFQLLRDKQILMNKARSGTEHHNLPYQQFIDRGYFTVITRPRPDGERVTQTTRVTAKGLAWLQKNMAQQGLLPLSRPA